MVCAHFQEGHMGVTLPVSGSLQTVCPNMVFPTAPTPPLCWEVWAAVTAGRRLSVEHGVPKEFWKDTYREEWRWGRV